jgi:hypothetical protein
MIIIAVIPDMKHETRESWVVKHGLFFMFDEAQNLKKL